MCCKKPHYGPQESKIINEHIKVLKENDWVEHYKGGWGSPIVIALKPHQESIEDIDDFLWRMCISYRGLNMVTQPFEYPIGWCDAAIEGLGDSASTLWCICLDKAQGYHRVGVKCSDCQNLAFFGPDSLKYAFKVLPFGPTKAYCSIRRWSVNFKMNGHFSSGWNATGRMSSTTISRQVNQPLYVVACHWQTTMKNLAL